MLRRCGTRHATGNGTECNPSHALRRHERGRREQSLGRRERRKGAIETADDHSCSRDHLACRFKIQKTPRPTAWASWWHHEGSISLPSAEERRVQGSDIDMKSTGMWNSETPRDSRRPFASGLQPMSDAYDDDGTRLRISLEASVRIGPSSRLWLRQPTHFRIANSVIPHARGSATGATPRRCERA